MNTDIYKISNSKTICRVLPFFARGRKMILFLEGISSPLVSLHKKFLTWAYKMLLSLKVTAQVEVMTWYLNHLFRSRFAHEEDTFVISDNYAVKNLVAFNYSEATMLKVIDVRIYDTDEQEEALSLSKPIGDIDDRIESDLVFIHAPRIKPDADYSEREYRRDILSAINEYKTSFVGYVIEIG